MREEHVNPTSLAESPTKIDSPFTKIKNDLEALFGEDSSNGTGNVGGNDDNNGNNEINKHKNHPNHKSYHPPALREGINNEVAKNLWIGNLDPTVGEQEIRQVFQPFGNIESIKLLPSKECAFVNFDCAEDAIRAKEKLRGVAIGNMIIKIGFGRATGQAIDKVNNQVMSIGSTDTLLNANNHGVSSNFSEKQSNTSGIEDVSQRTVWIGQLMPDCTKEVLTQEFSKFGIIEGCRMLNSKGCAFITFAKIEDAEQARKTMNGATIDSSIIKTGYTKGPSTMSIGSNAGGKTTSSNSSLSRGPEGTMGRSVPRFRSLFGIISALSMEEDESTDSIATISNHHPHNDNNNNNNQGLEEFKQPIPQIPSTLRLPPELNSTVLRECRRRIENNLMSSAEVDEFTKNMLEHLLAASVDPVGNILVQKLLEKGNEITLEWVLEALGSWIAAIGIHKNGTWVIQKLISYCHTKAHQRFIAEKLRPYLVPLLQDQFGNYVIQCCLPFEHREGHFIFEGLHHRCLEIATSRFGSRAMRSCLDHPGCTDQQRKLVAAAIINYAGILVKDGNGVIVVQWLLDSNASYSHMPLFHALKGNLATLCLHKVANSIIAKLLQSGNNTEANIVRDAFLQEVSDCEQGKLYSLLADSASATILLKALASSRPEQRVKVAYKLHPHLQKLEGKGLGHLVRIKEEVDGALELVKLEPRRRPSIPQLLSITLEEPSPSLSQSYTANIPLRTVGGPVCNKSIVKSIKDSPAGLSRQMQGEVDPILERHLKFGSLNMSISSNERSGDSTDNPALLVCESIKKHQSVKQAGNAVFGPSLLKKDDWGRRPSSPS